MSYPVVIHWPPTTGNEAAIAAIQSVATGLNLQLKSNVPNILNTFSFEKIYRHITFNSANLNTGVTFRVTGWGSPVDILGNPSQVFSLITEDIVGPAAAATITSLNIYQRIDSIKVQVGNANAIRVGFGTAGITDYVFLDSNRPSFQTSVQLEFLSRSSLIATVYQSLNRPETPDQKFGGKLIPFPHIPAFAVAPNLTGATDNEIGLLGITTDSYIASAPMSITWANMSATAADELFFTVIQQGIR